MAAHRQRPPTSRLNPPGTGPRHTPDLVRLLAARLRRPRLHRVPGAAFRYTTTCRREASAHRDRRQPPTFWACRGRAVKSGSSPQRSRDVERGEDLDSPGSPRHLDGHGRSAHTGSEENTRCLTAPSQAASRFLRYYRSRYSASWMISTAEWSRPASSPPPSTRRSRRRFLPPREHRARNPKDPSGHESRAHRAPTPECACSDRGRLELAHFLRIAVWVPAIIEDVELRAGVARTSRARDSANGTLVRVACLARQATIGASRVALSVSWETDPEHRRDGTCLSCGYLNPPGSSWCHRCGAGWLDRTAQPIAQEHAAPGERLGRTPRCGHINLVEGCASCRAGVPGNAKPASVPARRQKMTNRNQPARLRRASSERWPRKPLRSVAARALTGAAIVVGAWLFALGVVIGLSGGGSAERNLMAIGDQRGVHAVLEDRAVFDQMAPPARAFPLSAEFRGR